MRTITNRLQQDCKEEFKPTLSDEPDDREIPDEEPVESDILSSTTPLSRKETAKLIRDKERLHRFRWMRLQMHYRFPIQDFWHTAAMTCPDRAQKSRADRRAEEAVLLLCSGAQHERTACGCFGAGPQLYEQKRYIQYRQPADRRKQRQRKDGSCG